MHYGIINMLRLRRMLSMLRGSIAALRIETGSRNVLKREERICIGNT